MGLHACQHASVRVPVCLADEAVEPSSSQPVPPITFQASGARTFRPTRMHAQRTRAHTHAHVHSHKYTHAHARTRTHVHAHVHSVYHTHNVMRAYHARANAGVPGPRGGAVPGRHAPPHVAHAAAVRGACARRCVRTKKLHCWLYMCAACGAAASLVAHAPCSRRSCVDTSAGCVVIAKPK